MKTEHTVSDLQMWMQHFLWQDEALDLRIQDKKFSVLRISDSKMLKDAVIV